MRLTFRDLLATILVVAIGVPYVGYLLDGSVPFVQDARGMSAVGLVLGAAAFLVLRYGDPFDRYEKVTTAVAVGAFALGLVALFMAETTASEWLLAAFMASILIVWAMEIADHAGLVHHDAGAPAHV
ncbi:hypothetical protein [Ornithinimicrobium pekingense]|uniref:SPW repeat-containing protein n=1 Tax=Ornithinimicrobium pekingense TaxID=384677 RepID=A0ABQ2F8N7_9MICO|nr:hypothetical protein [Ornithinimicrobium pekingense]GGK62051.1 hypothetical protein GCM10011509_08080 [Ornithinimicrobium pekingense]